MRIRHRVAPQQAGFVNEPAGIESGTVERQSLGGSEEAGSVVSVDA